MASKTTQTLSISKLCRLCTVETFETGVNIFDCGINSSEPLVSIINRYLPIKIVDDGKLPREICQSCNLSVKDITSYFNLLASGQHRLRELWKEQLERLRREKKQFEDDSSSDFNIIITAPTANPDRTLFDENHVISLAIEGRESPRRRPGRPRKPKPAEISVELMLEDRTAHQPANNVDPEQALELMFKEAEEKRITSGDYGRHRRQRRVPQRFEGVVQGKELDAILSDQDLEEGEHLAEELMEENEELDTDETAVEKEDENESPTHSKPNKKLRVRFPKKRQFVCRHCCRTFVHSGHFTQHVSKCPHQSKFACLTCKEIYDTKEELAVHQEQSQHVEEVVNAEPEKEIDQQEEYKCICCEAIYNQQSAITKHIVEVHASENSIICELCGKVFTHPSSVIYHKEVAHSKRAFSCHICQKEFKHKQLLQRHLLVHSDDRPFVCHVCGQTFKTRANLYNHSNIHSEEKRYVCTYCDAQFSHKTSLTLHTRWHTGEKPFECNFCNKKFSQAGNLQEHLRIHTGEKPYSCNVCSKRFTTSSQRRLHMKRHTGERPYKCEFCGKDFLHKDSWECHLRRHRGEKPFSCEICQRTFSEKWALKKHARLHTGEKPYTCTVCNKAFSDLSNLQKHRKTHKNGHQVELADETVSNSSAANVADNQEGSANTLSTLSDGQHFIYVTTDQSQLLITTMGDQTGLPVLGTDGTIEYVQSVSSLQTRHQVIESSETFTLKKKPEEEEIGQLNSNQTVEFITQDGNRIRLTLPPNVDPYENVSEYLSTLNEQPS